MNAVTIHKDHLEVLADFTDDQLGLLLRALAADVLGDEPITLPPDLAVVRRYINNQNRRFSDQQSQKRKSKPNQPNQPNEPNEPKPPSVSVSVSETVTKDTPPSPPRGRRAPIADFTAFWGAYPKKMSKGDAEKAWKVLHPDSELLTKMLSALGRAKTCQDWTKEGGKYIPYPATWLRAKGWESDYGALNAPPDDPCWRELT